MLVLHYSQRVEKETTYSLKSKSWEDNFRPRRMVHIFGLKRSKLSWHKSHCQVAVSW